MPIKQRVLKRRALRIQQNDNNPLFLFTLTADEILNIADISKVSRDKAGKLIGYQRSEVRAHVEQIVEYLDSGNVVFPNSIIIALPSTVKFIKSRGTGVDDGYALTGTIEIPFPKNGEMKPGWIVDGQQRAIALSQSKKRDFPVPVNAFIADNVAIQREQFLRINNTKPLPRGLVTELLPEFDTVLPPRLAARKIPSTLCNYLNTDSISPFYRMIKRSSSTKAERKHAVITDTSIIKMLEESISSTSGCLFPYRNIATGETDFEGILEILTCYWNTVKRLFPDAWGKPPTKSRLMHGVGIRAVGRLMDRVMAQYDHRSKTAGKQVEKDLKLVVPYCRWTSGSWEDLSSLKWNELQNVPRHIGVLSNYLIRMYVEEKRGDR